MALGVAAGIKLGTSLIGAKKQKDAGKQADAIARENAERIKQETDKQLERTGRQQEFTMSSAQASQAGSGIRSGAGTTQSYLDEMQKTFQEDLDWIEQSGASQESIARAEGSLAKKQASAQAWGTVATGVSGVLDLWT